MEFFNMIVSKMAGDESLLNSEHCGQLSMLNEKMCEDVYILILGHFVENNRGKKGLLLDGKEIAYGATLLSAKDNKGLKFKVSSLPDDCQRLIVRYLKLVSSA